MRCNRTCSYRQQQFHQRNLAGGCSSIRSSTASRTSFLQRPQPSPSPHLTFSNSAPRRFTTYARTHRMPVDQNRLFNDADLIVTPGAENARADGSEITIVLVTVPTQQEAAHLTKDLRECFRPGVSPGDFACCEELSLPLPRTHTCSHSYTACLLHQSVEQDLIACSNALPGVTSTYKWQGAVCTDTEVLLVLKTIRSRVDAVTRYICSAHSYDEPEVVVLDVAGGSKGYLDWVRGCVREDDTLESFAGRSTG